VGAGMARWMPAHRRRVKQLDISFTDCCETSARRTWYLFFLLLSFRFFLSVISGLHGNLGLRLGFGHTGYWLLGCDFEARRLCSIFCASAKGGFEKAYAKAPTTRVGRWFSGVQGLIPFLFKYIPIYSHLPLYQTCIFRPVPSTILSSFPLSESHSSSAALILPLPTATAHVELSADAKGPRH
jgi:hypothetical protein